MAIKDVSGLPDHLVPQWVREARESRRKSDKRWEYYNLRGADGKTQNQRDLERGI